MNLGTRPCSLSLTDAGKGCYHARCQCKKTFRRCSEPQLCARRCGCSGTLPHKWVLRWAHLRLDETVPGTLWLGYWPNFTLRKGTCSAFSGLSMPLSVFPVAWARRSPEWEAFPAQRAPLCESSYPEAPPRASFPCYWHALSRPFKA